MTFSERPTIYIMPPRTLGLYVAVAFVMGAGFGIGLAILLG